MAMVDVDGSSQFSADSQPKSIGLLDLRVGRHPALSLYIHYMNRLNSRNGFGRDDSTINVDSELIETVQFGRFSSLSLGNSPVGITTKPLPGKADKLPLGLMYTEADQACHVGRGQASYFGPCARPNGQSPMSVSMSAVDLYSA